MPLAPVDMPDGSLGTPAGGDEGPLARAELKRRASGGLAIIGTRGLATLLLGFAGNVVVARLLTPHDFGVVAIGLAFVLVVGMLSDGGLGAGLIRRAEPPDMEELRGLAALQLAVTTGLAVVVAAAAAPFGQAGWVTALMVSSMPLVTLQFPGKIMLERSLRFRPLAAVELLNVLSYHAWAIGTVVAGLGVWGLASATVVRAAVAAAAMARVSPVGLVRPRFAWHRIRPLMAFGVRFQANTLTWLVRDQGVNAAIAVIASVSTLGLWSLARRLMEVPFVLFDSLWRVSFPAMSQLVAAKEDAAPVISRAVAMAAVASGMLLAGLAGSAPGLVPGLFGEQWREAAVVLPWACLGLCVGGSVSTATAGYLFAVGDVAAVLRANIFQTATMLAVTIGLLPILGVSAVGLGWLAAAVVDASLLGRATSKWTSVRLVGPLIAPVAVGIVSGAVGWLIAERGGADLLSGIAGGACSVLCFQAGLMLFHRRVLFETFRFFVGSIRAAASRGAP
jgi:O-antigen/teichoic acid export membrane protein